MAAVSLPNVKLGVACPGNFSLAEQNKKGDLYALVYRQVRRRIRDESNDKSSSRTLSTIMVNLLISYNLVKWRKSRV